MAPTPILGVNAPNNFTSAQSQPFEAIELQKAGNKYALNGNYLTIVTIFVPFVRDLIKYIISRKQAQQEDLESQPDVVAESALRILLYGAISFFTCGLIKPMKAFIASNTTPDEYEQQPHIVENSADTSSALHPILYGAQAHVNATTSPTLPQPQPLLPAPPTPAGEDIQPQEPGLAPSYISYGETGAIVQPHALDTTSTSITSDDDDDDDDDNTTVFSDSSDVSTAPTEILASLDEAICTKPAHGLGAEQFDTISENAEDARDSCKKVVGWKFQ